MKKVYTLLAVLLLGVLPGSLFAQQTWYSLKSGDWDQADTWTLDPAGAIAVSSAVPANGDNVVILSGKTVVVPDGVGDYASPERIVSISSGTVTIHGQLDLRSSTGNVINKLKGDGRLLMSADNYPTITTSDADFINQGEGEGTVVFYGSSNISLTSGNEFCNLEVNFDNDSYNLLIDRDLTLNGNLSVKVGRFKIGDTSGANREITVYGNIIVGALGRMTTDGANSFHWLDVYGNLTNNGIIDFTRGNPYEESTGGAVKVRFKGSENTEVLLNGDTELYRIFVDKGSDKTFAVSISASEADLFSLKGPVSGTTTDSEDGSAGWQKLPIVIENGTLELGSDIEIETLGESMSGDAPNEFTIPETGCLWVNGADVTTSQTTGDNKGITLYGKLKVSSGLFTTPGGTNGLNYGTNGENAIFEITGGTANLTQIRPYNNAERFTYIQSGGTVDFFAAPQNDVSAVLHMGYYTAVQPSNLNSDFVFEMTGGDMVFNHANSGNGWVSGIRLEVNDDNCNVSGGTVTVYETSGIDFDIYSTIPLYNLDIKENGSSNDVRFTGWYGGAFDNYYWTTDFYIVNNLTIESGTTFNDNGHKVYIGGNLTIAGAYTQSGSLVFNGDRDGEIVNNTGSVLTLPGLYINKDKYPTSGEYYTISLTGGDNIAIDGTLKLQRGAFDVVDYWPTVTDSVVIRDGDLTASATGGLVLNGSSAQVIKGVSGKDYNFGDIILNNTSGLSLASNVDVDDFTFGTSAKVNMGTYNLTVNGSISNASSSNYFYTAGNSSDGGLTLYFTVPTTAATLATYNIGASSSDYSTAVVKSFAGQSTASSGYLTVIPINDYHPSTDDTQKGDVLAYYWKTKVSGFDDLDNNIIALEFTSTKDLKGFSAAYLDDYDWKIGDTKYKNGDKTLYFDYTAGNGAYTSLINSDYTAGTDNGNGQIPIAAVVVYKSTGVTSDWHTSTTWEDADGNNGVPGSADVAVVQSGHSVVIGSNNALASQVEIDGELIVSHNTSGHSIDIIKGDGTLVYENDFDYGPNNLISGDHSEFCSSFLATIEFSGTGSYYMPAQSLIPYYPNLHISGGGTKHTPYNGSVYINGDLYVDDANIDVNGIWGGELSIGGDLLINTGTFNMSTAYNHNIYVGGDIAFSGTGVLTGGTSSNGLYLPGDVTLVDGAEINYDGKFIFEGSESAVVSLASGTANVDFYKIYINKDETESVAFNTGFTLSGPTDDATKSLILESGICHLNSSDIDLTLNTGNYHYNIPSTSELIVDNGAIVEVSGSDYGINLDGVLTIDNGAQALINQGTGNCIQFTSSGQSALTVSNSGVLNVGGQIRRSTSSSDGYLDFTQSGGLVTVGSTGATITSRGVFEIFDGAFSQGDNDQIFILDGVGSTVPSLNFNPGTTSYGSGSGFTLQGVEVIGLYSSVDLNDITVDGDAGCEALLITQDISLNDLTIGANSVFDANDLDVYVSGDFSNGSGIDGYLAGTNTTYFEGTADQTISGTTNFYNLVKQTGTSQLILDASTAVDVANDFELVSGTLNTGTNTLNVEGNVINEGITISDSGTEGIMLSGSDVQQIDGSGSFGILSIDNTNGVVVPTQSGAIAFTDALRMIDGVLDIGRNLLVLEEGAYVVPVNAFSETNMIQTNLSFTDNGIEKYFPEITSSTSFTYPIGSLGKYTPIVFDISNKSADSGSIRVKAANEPHISVLDADNVLQYNWTLDAENISGFTATAKMYSVDGDAIINGVPMDGTEAEKYITARILLQSTLWNKFDEDDFEYVAGDMDISTFYFSNTDDKGIDGDYTAGLIDAIPDQVQSYITVIEGGDYSNTSTWATYDPTTGDVGAASVDVPDGGPRGSIIYVDHTLNYDENGEASYRTFINESGIVNIGTSYGHRLGDVFGTGTLRLESGDIPAGFYKSFFEADGGTLEYTGSDDYDVLSELPNINNLVLSGTGLRRLPNIDVQLYGNMTIDGPEVENTHNSNILIKGNLEFASGSYDAGIDESTVTFNGSSLQSITGAQNFIEGEGGALFNLEIDNTSGLVLENEIEVDNLLELTSGVINTDAGLLTITNTSSVAVVGGSSSSYVEGYLMKIINGSSNFAFPVGENGRYGELKVYPDASTGGIWKVRYRNVNPGDDSYSPESLVDPIKYVSHNEYWVVLAPASGTAQLTLRWDDASGVNPAESGFSAAQWLSTAWNRVALGTASGDIDGGTVPLSSAMSFNENTEGNLITFAAYTIPAYTWEGDDSTSPTDWFTPANWSGNVVPSAASVVTIADVTNQPIVLGSTTAQVYTLIVNSGATITLGEGSRMTVNGDVNMANDYSLIIHSAYDNPASFINYGIVSNPIQIEWDYPKLQYLYIAHAVDGATVGDYGVPKTDQFVYSYPNNWDTYISNTSFPLNGELTGYSAILASDATITTQGTMYSGDQTASLGDSWNLLGNTYASYIDLTADALDFGNAQQTIWYRILSTNTTVEEYASYNVAEDIALNGAGTTMSPGQAFWVRSYESTSMVLSPSARIHDVGGLKSTKALRSDVLRLTMGNSYGSDEIAVLFRNSGNETPASNDSEKYMASGKKVPQIFTTKGNKKMAVNVLPELVESHDVELGYKVATSAAGELEFNATNITSFLPGVNVTLEDKVTGRTYDLRQTPTVTFTSAAMTNSDRFVLHFANVTTDVDEMENGSSNNVNLFVSPQSVLEISCDWDEYTKEVRIYSTDGRLVFEDEMNGNNYSEQLNTKPGIYIVTISTESKHYHKEVGICK